MKRLTSVLFLLSFLLSVPLADAQKKDKKWAKEDAERATPQEYAQLNQMKEIVGKLPEFDAGVKTLVLRVEIPHYEPNPNYKAPAGQATVAQAYQRLMLDQQRAMTITNPHQRAQALQRVQRDTQQLMQKMAQANSKAQAAAGKNGQNMPFKVTVQKKDFELEVQDKVVTRRSNPPMEYDSRGYPKEYTKDELAKMRGKDTTKPGLEAKYDDLAAGQQIKLYLTATKSAKTDDKKDDGATIKPTVRMILITADAPAGSEKEAPKPKKKK